MNKKGNMYKIVILGDSQVGKTCFITRYYEGFFENSNLIIIGFDYKIKKLQLGDGKEIMFELWDTIGQDRFRSISKNLIKKSQGFIIIYDITRRKTFNEVWKFIETVIDETSKDALIIIVGAKLDLEDKREVSKEEGIKFAKEFNYPFFECSAKDNININEIVEELAKKIVEKFEITRQKLESTKIKSKNKKCS